ncbi:hypothetical protein B8T70_21300 [Flavobacterium sp. AJR]|nr:hypothetical protein B8T70_21300 [Flavobacterium sp. AJR]
MFKNNLKWLQEHIKFQVLKVLKEEKNEYLHWSVKANKFGLETRESQAPLKERSIRTKHHG